jgi:hypothetical protein
MQLLTQLAFSNHNYEVKMRHTFRINVYQKGYTLYSGYGISNYQEFPLDIQSNNISKNYLSAQKRIDAVMETQMERWCFCLTNNYIEDNPVIAYGCLLQIPDDEGRIGISFIHGIESDENIGIDRIVVSIAHLLSQKTINHLSHLISKIARGTVRPEKLHEFLANYFSINSNYPKQFPSHNLNPIKEIQQDCGGASTVTWLAMAISHLDSPAPWEVYEKYSYQDKVICTVSSFIGAQDKQLLSEYIYKAGHLIQAGSKFLNGNNINKDADTRSVNRVVKSSYINTNKKKQNRFLGIFRMFSGEFISASSHNVENHQKEVFPHVVKNVNRQNYWYVLINSFKWIFLKIVFTVPLIVMISTIIILATQVVSLRKQNTYLIHINSELQNKRLINENMQNSRERMQEEKVGNKRPLQQRQR